MIILKDLLARVEAATGQDRELDDALEDAFGGPHGIRSGPAPLTSSIDAAVALVECLMPEWSWEVERVKEDAFSSEVEEIRKKTTAAALAILSKQGHVFTAAHSSAPLAILGAMLKAKIAEAAR
jgi:hypothetical protein